MTLIDSDLLARAQHAVDEIAPEGVRVDILNGALHMTPPPSLPHQLIQDDIRRLLADRAPTGARTLVEPGVYASLDPEAEYQQPDVAVFIVVADQERLTGENVELVVEVVSPSNERTPDYQQGVLERAARFGIDWVCFVHPTEQRVTWWRQGTKRGAGPDWCATLNLAAHSGNRADQTRQRTSVT